ncbi:MAG: DUF642 domain-containing protein, partial [Rubrivivax sp.]|nr:DUF642 domain-containing protein [Rubrivivax sp.]
MTVTGNVIGASGRYGIWLLTGSGHVVKGNLIGVAADGTTARANGSGNICVGGSCWGASVTASNVTIGGLVAGEANTIANGPFGVRVSATTAYGVSIRGNVFRNTTIGIDLGNDGVTANDGAKGAANTGPNQGMDKPVLASAVWLGDQLQLVGYVGSAAGQTTFASATVDVYKSSNNTSGFGDGQVYLGTLTSDANGNVNGRITLPGGVTLSAGDAITATATDGSGNTSEFSANLTVTAAAAFQNGSFENGSSFPATNNFVTLQTGDTRLTGWTVTYSMVDLVGVVYYSGAFVSQGSYGVDLNGGPLQIGGVQQSFITTPGTSYTVIFDVKSGGLCGASSNQLRVTAAATTQDFTLNTTPYFLSRSVSFTATSTLSSLRFESLNGATCMGPVIDNVRVGQSAILSGTVFEDPNYGGGAGRDRATAVAGGGSARSGATVEVYDASGNFLATTTTDVNGAYAFTVIQGSTYQVRVVNSTVTSARTGYVAALLPVQTFRTQAVA